MPLDVADPLVTVVIPTRNRRDQLEASLRSALVQQGVDLEVVVVDDGSTDGTAEAIAALGDPRVKVVRHETPRGVSAARNAGIDRARGRWTAFLDDDDVWAPTKLAAQLGALAEEPGTDWCATSCVWIDKSGRVVGHRQVTGRRLGPGQLLAANVVPAGGSSMLVRTEVVRALGGFDRSLALYEDWDLWIRLALRGPGVGLDEPLVGYRVWGSTSAGAGPDLQAAWAAVCDRHRPAMEAAGVRPDLADLHRYRAFRALRSRRFGEAASAYRRLALLQPALAQRVRSQVAATACQVAGPLLAAVLAFRDRRSVPAPIRRAVTPWLTTAP